MSNVDIEILRRQLDHIEASGAAETRGGSGPPALPHDAEAGWRATVDTRLAQLDGGLAGLRTSMDGARWVIGIVAVVMIGGFSFLGFQLNRLEGRADRIEMAIAGIPTRLSDEFHAMRSEMAAQTSAIANAITATRQAQPAPPQIIILPAPQPSEKPTQR